MSVIWRGKCCTKTVVLRLPVSSCPSATEMASNKLQGNLPFRWQSPCPPMLKCMEPPGQFPEVSMPVFSTINLMPGSETHWLRWLTFQGVKLSVAALGLCLFVSYFPARAPCQTRERVPSSFLFLIQSLAKTTWSPFHKPLSTPKIHLLLHLDHSSPLTSSIGRILSAAHTLLWTIYNKQIGMGRIWIIQENY